MGRILIVLLATVLVAGPAQIAKAHHRPGPCPIRWRFEPVSEHRGEIELAVRKLIRCAVRRWPVPGGASKALEVFECESGWWPWAIGGDNLGVGQHKDDYWPSRARRLLKRAWFPGRRFPAPYGSPGDRRLAFNARANVLVSVRMAHRVGWGPWACA